MGYLSLEDFKKWIAEQRDAVIKINQSKFSGLIDLEVEPKIRAQRIAANVISYDGNLHEIVEDFRKNGGRIADVDGINFLIEVSTGGFSIHRCFVKKKVNNG